MALLLNKSPEVRPSVSDILSLPYIRLHIQHRLNSYPLPAQTPASVDNRRTNTSASDAPVTPNSQLRRPSSVCPQQPHKYAFLRCFYISVFVFYSVYFSVPLFSPTSPSSRRTPIAMQSPCPPIPSPPKGFPQVSQFVRPALSSPSPSVATAGPSAPPGPTAAHMHVLPGVRPGSSSGQTATPASRPRGDLCSFLQPPAAGSIPPCVSVVDRVVLTSERGQAIRPSPVRTPLPARLNLPSAPPQPSSTNGTSSHLRTAADYDGSVAGRAFGSSKADGISASVASIGPRSSPAAPSLATKNSVARIEHISGPYHHPSQLQLPERGHLPAIHQSHILVREHSRLAINVPNAGSVASLVTSPPPLASDSAASSSSFVQSTTPNRNTTPDICGVPLTTAAGRGPTWAQYVPCTYVKCSESESTCPRAHQQSVVSLSHSNLASCSPASDVEIRRMRVSDPSVPAEPRASDCRGLLSDIDVDPPPVPVLAEKDTSSVLTDHEAPFKVSYVSASRSSEMELSANIPAAVSIGAEYPKLEQTQQQEKESGCTFSTAKEVQQAPVPRVPALPLAQSPMTELADGARSPHPMPSSARSTRSTRSSRSVRSTTRSVPTVSDEAVVHSTKLSEVHCTQMIDRPGNSAADVASATSANGSEPTSYTPTAAAAFSKHVHRKCKKSDLKKITQELTLLIQVATRL